MALSGPYLAYVEPGRIVFLFGTSSVGKTSTAMRLQEVLPTPHLHFGLDSLFAMIPNAHKSPGGRSGDGFWYEEVSQQPRALVIRMGRVGALMHAGMRAAVRGFVATGNNLIVDEMPLTAGLMDAWRRELVGVSVLWVRLDASDQVLAQREAARGTRAVAGLARGHAHVPRQIDWADLNLDSGELGVDARADEIHAAVTTHPGG